MRMKKYYFANPENLLADCCKKGAGVVIKSPAAGNLT